MLDFYFVVGYVKFLVVKLLMYFETHIKAIIS